MTSAVTASIAYSLVSIWPRAVRTGPPNHCRRYHRDFREKPRSYAFVGDFGSYPDHHSFRIYYQRVITIARLCTLRAGMESFRTLLASPSTRYRTGYGCSWSVSVTIHKHSQILKSQYII
ncbi:uncharacterized protein CTRU02_205987 [Colletotrichum truncatum]|uniref:Uncharacterized protein n=1 Tax=Colletotrichum truncatum TaxID=5467 RepID=A0ACC3Z5K3_COLTU|nr:uncharacterized protein CTRU02_04821 [Colletotrichum truncatum]KAF6795258.1 hypothetical protein CTRU02_04821 [Colletotrichum truncatum]